MLPNGGQPSPQQIAKAQQAALAFSACMRSHGIKDFPDPTFTGGGVTLRLRGGPGSDLDPSSPLFQKAQTACQCHPARQARRRGRVGSDRAPVPSRPPPRARRGRRRASSSRSRSCSCSRTRSAAALRRRRSTTDRRPRSRPCSGRICRSRRRSARRSATQTRPRSPCAPGTAPANVQQAQDSAATARGDARRRHDGARPGAGDARRRHAEARDRLRGEQRRRERRRRRSERRQRASVRDRLPGGRDRQAERREQHVEGAGGRARCGRRRATRSAQAQASASVVGPTSSYTMLPTVGRVVRRGGALYAIGGEPVVLLYGAVPPWRAFAARHVAGPRTSPS